MEDESERRAPASFFFVVFAGVIGFVIIAGWAFGGLTVFAGRCIRDRKRFIFVLAMAAINCAFLPYGTLLGVLTFILQAKVETKHEFQQTRAR